MPNQGVFKVDYNIRVAGVYKTHIQFRLNSKTYVAIKGSPYTTVIKPVTCPIVGEPPCNSQGECLDDGTCDCKQGWDGEYCEVDLTLLLRIGIVVENAALGALVFMV